VSNGKAYGYQDLFLNIRYLVWKKIVTFNGGGTEIILLTIWLKLRNKFREENNLDNKGQAPWRSAHLPQMTLWTLLSWVAALPGPMPVTGCYGQILLIIPC
jgi:hypothetical protein